MRATRRNVLKAGGVAGGVLAIGRLTSKPLSTLAAKPAAAAAEVGEEWVPTTCWIGKQDCGLLARKVNGRLVKLEGDPSNPRNLGRLCPKGVAQIQAIYDPNRVKSPLVRTNEKGISGKWKPVSWDEALELTAARINEARKKDKRLFVWQKGRSKAKVFYDDAFTKATGAVKLHHGAFCSDAAYRASEYTIGFHGGFHPDFKHTNYLISWGWGLTAAGGNQLCQITWHQEFVQARERGMKMVHVDPFRRNAGQFPDEWLPIRPGTDLAFFLAIAGVLLEQGYLDTPYLTRYTNGPFLVKEDGSFLRSGEGENAREQVWDVLSGAPKAFDAEGVEPALEGGFDHGGERLTTAFEALKRHLAGATPEWAAGITGLDAGRIRRVALEFGEHASIGSTKKIDGVDVPYRPVSMMGYHVAQQELGFQACRAALIPFMLVGAVESVGGLRSDLGRSIHANYKALDEIEIGEGPYNLYLNKSKFYPINSNNSSIVAHVMNDPKRWNTEVVPEAMLIHMANPLASFLDIPAIHQSYLKYKFIAVIDQWMSETADLFADVVLPAATIEKYEGPINASSQYVNAQTMRIPPIEPLFESKGDIDIYLDLTERMGVLFGEKGYLDEVNKSMKLNEQYALSLNTKPTTREIFDRWARQSGLEGGIDYFRKKGVAKVKAVPAEQYYAIAWEKPYGGIRHRLFGESLGRYRGRMKELGAEEIFWQDYTPLPTWRAPTMDKSPPQYDLYLISYKKIEFKQSRSTHIPILIELAGDQGLVVNPKTADERGISEGDEVVVESQNAVTGETRRLTTRALLSESIRPDTVAMSAHYGVGKRTHPWAKGLGPTPNTIFFSGPGYVSNTADQSFHVKVRVFKGEGG